MPDAIDNGMGTDGRTAARADPVRPENIPNDRWAVMLTTYTHNESDMGLLLEALAEVQTRARQEGERARLFQANYLELCGKFGALEKQLEELKRFPTGEVGSQARQAHESGAPNTFVECEQCALKPGAPYLCASCLHNRAAIANLSKLRAADGKRMNELAKEREAEREAQRQQTTEAIAQVDEQGSVVLGLRGDLRVVQEERDALLATLKDRELLQNHLLLVGKRVRWKDHNFLCTGVKRGTGTIIKQEILALGSPQYPAGVHANACSIEESSVLERREQDRVDSEDTKDIKALRDIANTIGMGPMWTHAALVETIRSLAASTGDIEKSVEKIQQERDSYRDTAQSFLDAQGKEAEERKLLARWLRFHPMMSLKALNRVRDPSLLGYIDRPGAEADLKLAHERGEWERSLWDHDPRCFTFLADLENILVGKLKLSDVEGKVY